MPRAKIGILMLQSRFPRIAGDMGNAVTWDFPVAYKTVPNATPDRVVRQNPRALLPHFIDAGRDLIEEGCHGITTTCGFLSLFQDELKEALNVPVITSSLLQVGMVNAALPRARRAGILTISASALTPAHLRAANVPDGTPIGTTENGDEFTRVILNDEADLDVEKARADNVAAAVSLKQANPELGAIVLECTNMTPYAADIQRATDLPVYSIVTLINWFQASLLSRTYPSR